MRAKIKRTLAKTKLKTKARANTKFLCDLCNQLHNTRGRVRWLGKFYCGSCKHQVMERMPSPKTFEEIFGMPKIIRAVGKNHIRGFIYFPGRYAGMKVKVIPLDNQGNEIPFQQGTEPQILLTNKKPQPLKNRQGGRRKG